MKASGLLVACGLLGACSSSVISPSPAPSPKSVTVTLTVRVYDRASHAPLPAAQVHTQATYCQTTEDGDCQLTVSKGESTTVAVWANGYRGAVNSGVLQSNERWTFYLEVEL